MRKERRRHFFINKPLQLRYMAYLVFPLLLVSAVSMISVYLGIWGGILDAFSDERIRNDLLIASRLTEYEQARSLKEPPSVSALSFFKQTERLSQRQREVFKDILDDTNRKLIAKFILLLFFIAWGSIYFSHKIAGPLYRFHATLEAIEQGDFSIRIRLRKADEAQLLAKRFNLTLENLDQTFSRIKNIVRQNESDPAQMTALLKQELAKIKTSANQ
ncbi:MAG: methyl-accepting chemotaxis protein [Candidatus Omnitrophica bacterium]|nr:methyl-accepting chemotaxis protein [Candidatus Omnitrophota bacterium]